MAFYRSQGPRQAAISFKDQLLLAIGHHAFIHLPKRPGVRDDGFAPQTIETKKTRSPNDLKDGQEVEVIAWRPQSAQGVTYHIRRLSDGGEWWIRAFYLRKTAAAQVAAD
jgi:hypothetical protein